MWAQCSGRLRFWQLVSWKLRAEQTIAVPLCSSMNREVRSRSAQFNQIRSSWFRNSSAVSYRLFWPFSDVNPSCFYFFSQLPLLTWCFSAWPLQWSSWPSVFCSLRWRASLCHLKVSCRWTWSSNLHPQGAASGCLVGEQSSAQAQYVNGKQKSVSSFSRRRVCVRATDAEPFSSSTGRGNLSSYHHGVLELSNIHLRVADTAESKQPSEVLHTPTF